MVLRYKLTDKARQDLRNAIEYYQAQGKNLPEQFLRDFIKTRQHICEFPNTYQIIVKKRRRANFLGKFPILFSTLLRLRKSLLLP
jgi:plasmid stabilization system protein ParE